MKKCTDGEALIARLKRIEGQIRGIARMVEEDAECENIIIQISSAKSALHNAGKILLEDHLRHCVLTGMEDGKTHEEVVIEFTSALDQFIKI